MIHGDAATRRVTLNGEELDPGPSQAIVNHSPEGFGWRYGGSTQTRCSTAGTNHRGRKSCCNESK